MLHSSKIIVSCVQSHDPPAGNAGPSTAFNLFFQPPFNLWRAPENVLFKDADSLTLKLADFGLALNLREERAVTRVGTLGECYVGLAPILKLMTL